LDGGFGIDDSKVVKERSRTYGLMARISNGSLLANHLNVSFSVDAVTNLVSIIVQPLSSMATSIFKRTSQRPILLVLMALSNLLHLLNAHLGISSNLTGFAW
jgi:hypothetical protein